MSDYNAKYHNYIGVYDLTCLNCGLKTKADDLASFYCPSGGMEYYSKLSDHDRAQLRERTEPQQETEQ